LICKTGILPLYSGRNNKVLHHKVDPFRGQNFSGELGLLLGLVVVTLGEDLLLLWK